MKLTNTVCDGLWPSFACKYVVFTWLKPYFNVRALILYECEGSSQPIEPIEHANNFDINIFDFEA